jgi:PAS domain S-box-containing protein
MIRNIRVLLVPDCTQKVESILAQLRSASYDPVWRTAENEAEFLSGIEDVPDVIIGSRGVSMLTAERVLELLEERAVRIPLLFLEEREQIKEQPYYVQIPRNRPEFLDALLDELVLFKNEDCGTLEAGNESTLLAAVVEASEDAIIGVTLEGRVLTWNPGAERIFGYQAEEIKGRSVGRLIPCELKEQTTLISNQIREGKRIRHLEMILIRKDGSRIEVSIMLAPLKNARGEVTCASIVGRDLTDKRRAERAIQRTEELYRRAISGADAVPYSYDFRSGKYTFIGDGIRSLIGYGPEEINRDLWCRIIISSVMQGEMVGRSKEEAAKRSLAGELRNWRCDMLIAKRNGEQRWISDHAVFNLDETGLPIGSCGILQDVTERKMAEGLLRETNERFQNVARVTSDVIWDWDILRNELWWSDGFAKTFGYEVAGLPPGVESWKRFIHPDDTERVLRQLNEVIQGEQEFWQDEYRFICSNGTIAEVLDKGYLIRNEHGQAVRMVGAMVNITERKRSEEQIRDQARLLDLAQDAILICDSEEQIIYWNHGAERLYGWKAQDVLGRKSAELMYKDAIAHSAARDVLVEKREWSGELRQITKDGKEIIVASRWTLMRDSVGQAKSMLIINTDITDKKKLEVQLLRAQRMESIGVLASGIAHDLNNILAPITIASQILRMKPLDEETEQMLSRIESSAQRGAEVVRQVLTFARGIEGQRTVLQPKHLMREVIKIIKETFPKNITLSFRVEDVWPVSGDATQLHQVLLNLCVNARDAMPSGGVLSIGAENILLDDAAVLTHGAKAGPYVVLKVQDTGSGIPKEILDKIFEPFFTTKDLGKGTGLGLSTVSGIVKSHGGYVNVYSEEGRGATFKIYLPATPDGQALAAGKGQNTLPRGDGELILVVDDEASIREVTRKIFVKHGYQVLTANDGAEAVAVYAGRDGSRIRLVLTDIMMPRMEGIALIKALKKINPDVKIIASSGLTQAPGQVDRADELKVLGVKTFLNKPYTAEKLLTAVHNQLAVPQRPG